MLPKYIVFLVIVLLTGFFQLSCSKDDNPTEASSGDLVVAVASNLMNSSFQPTIIRAELLFDGSTIIRANFSTANANASLSGSITGVSKGTHTVAFKIVEQTSTPNTYETVGANLVYTVGGSTNTIDLGGRQKSMETGESISYIVNLE